MSPTTLTDAPFSLVVDEQGVLRPATSTVERRLSQMKGMYHDGAAEAQLLAGDDPLVYEVFQYDMPEHVGELVVCTTLLYPGRVGDEFFMTKGHYHEQRDRAEVYYGLSGEGQLVVAYEGRHHTVAMGPKTVAYVPPHWAHRTVNTGDEPFVFLAVYHGDAGHDYGSIETEGFPQRVLDRDGSVAIVPQDEL
ncbi:MAG TPA: glucose-6-phosphate isomerase family protein [Baekduia sp.]|jgi:glucose-6-phosphate isomerase|nr:glucose-6-phosphate isomerase family protein [Baekduia sp.]